MIHTVSYILMCVAFVAMCISFVRLMRGYQRLTIAIKDSRDRCECLTNYCGKLIKAADIRERPKDGQRVAFSVNGELLVGTYDKNRDEVTTEDNWRCVISFQQVEKWSPIKKEEVEG